MGDSETRQTQIQLDQVIAIFFTTTEGECFEVSFPTLPWIRSKRTGLTSLELPSLGQALDAPLGLRLDQEGHN